MAFTGALYHFEIMQFEGQNRLEILLCSIPRPMLKNDTVKSDAFAYMK